MKRRLLITLSSLSLLVAVSVLSCKKSNEEPAPNTNNNSNNNNNNGPTVSMKLDNTAFTASSSNFTIQDGNRLQVHSTITSGGVEVQITDTIVGTYTLASNANYIYFIDKTYGIYKQYFTTSGTATITSFGNNKVSGTFSGTIKDVNNENDSIIVTNGIFINVVKY